MKIITLDKMEVGQSGIIQNVVDESVICRRLLEMGVTPKTSLKVVRFAPLGDPMEIELRGYHLLIRKCDAAMIEILLDERTQMNADKRGADERR